VEDRVVRINVELVEDRVVRIVKAM